MGRATQNGGEREQPILKDGGQCEEGRETAKTTAVSAAAKRAALELLWDGQFVRAVPPVNTCGTGRLEAERRLLT